ncbi:zf-HC2 domain-containing protein [Actinobacillus equuli subsp. haemolyticus]|uniref:Zf-HC2 domain-containing protein n=1 Tax=Actinobacillus equuli subsp. equuli TaxID=202947 RepID=A0A9X4G5G8_ACTEU|nr:zf-HC2 domain-containing protein [Actinobacillus equuli]MDE8035326.1 zf-HC2 domain-containing protein [Actinobacillus equuli subsp. equuli]MDG4947622.1 zf-HC2 domain-containing protein [Actinobacillus equuli subsp. haemolyticus]WGE41713.1 zf-HC2 domain-containing protein [Actinobacillus equuli subsp. haemolyticus]WGE46078.1 zf-HC2 domain-containing protein [Actinobacillus equuli subsp. haemolyticus]WGE50276.1 zf-HC2 domain-containing protein [Actinobacillus equuli subsp. haemolyticus]
MNCEHASELISLSCEQKLKVKDSVQLQVHLWLCPKCRHFKQNNDKLREMLKEYCNQTQKEQL